MKIEIKRLCKRFGYKEIFKDFNLELTSENINCIIGNSGGGKSTLLNILAGITSKDDGEIIGVNKEDISYVFQEDRLIPWKSIFDNLRLVIKNKHNKEDINKKIDDILSILDIKEAKFLYPDELSGGMKQKVNIARALLYDFNVLLLDEPFRSLDIKIKNSIMNLIRTISKEKEITIILVSHNKDEVKALADNIFLLDGYPTKVIIEGDRTIIDNVFSRIIR